MPNTIIRPIKEPERSAWEHLFSAYADFYNVTLEPGTTDSVWSWIFDSDNDFWCDVAEDSDHQIVGFTQYQLMHRSLGGGMVVYLSDLYVNPEIRGTGAGRKLINHVFEFARSNNISNVRWLTQDFNYAARQLYDSYGRKSDFILYSFPVE